MRRNIDEKAQAQRRKGAWKSVIVSSIWFLLSAAMILTLRHLYVPEGFWSTIMLIVGLLELGMIIPVWILLKIRLKEIEGGEEDEAAQY